MEEMAIIEAEEGAKELSIKGNTVYDKIMSQVIDYGFCATFSTDDRAGQKKLYKARNASFLLRDYMETPLEIVDAAWAPSEVSGEDGEIKTVMAVYLIDVEGNTYLSTSNGVCSSAAELFNMSGELESFGEEPITVVCRETNTAKGRRYKYLDVE